MLQEQRFATFPTKVEKRNVESRPGTREGDKSLVLRTAMQTSEMLKKACRQMLSLVCSLGHRFRHDTLDTIKTSYLVQEQLHINRAFPVLGGMQLVPRATPAILLAHFIQNLPIGKSRAAFS